MEDEALAFEPDDLDVSDSDDDFEVDENTDISDDLDLDTHLDAAYEALESEDEDDDEEDSPSPQPNSAKAERLSEEVMDRAREAGYDPETIEAISQITDPVELASAIQEAEQELVANHQREIQEYAERQRQIEPLQQVSEYWKGYLGQLGVDPAQAVNALLSTEHTLRTGTPDQKRQALEYLKQSYGIEASEEGFDAYEDPQVKQLRSELQQIRNSQAQFFQAQQQQHEQLELRAAEDEIIAFQNETDERGNPVAPLLEFVQDDMAKLIRSGMANSLKEAYEQAIWSNPDTRQELLRRQAETDAHMRMMRAKKAEKAKRANVRSKTSSRVIEKHDNWEDELSAAYDRINP